LGFWVKDIAWIPILAIIGAIVGFLLAASFRICAEWDRMAILRLGRFKKMAGPGIFFMIPVIDCVKYVVDTRIIPYDVPKQKTLTSDNIPVLIDAIVYYKVTDPKASVLNIDDYEKGTRWGATTVLRDVIGKTALDSLLGEREKIGQLIQEQLDKLTGDWGVKVTNVEIRDVIIPEQLEDAISREPAAEREKRARLKLAEAEKLAAKIIYDAAQVYKKDPVALQLRSMNMLYEMCMEGKGMVIFVPTETHLGMPQPLGVYGIADKIDKILGKEKEKE
jgi:regulator of protease activity HflC (stomatin/prohibitin superfamily)